MGESVRPFVSLLSCAAGNLVSSGAGCDAVLLSWPWCNVSGGDRGVANTKLRCLVSWSDGVALLDHGTRIKRGDLYLA